MSAADPTSPPASTRGENPYVGPRSFRTGERLFGRDREVGKLFNLLLAERIVLLYSPSGAGKSSLLNAGLIPRLREEGFRIHPTVRVGMDPPAQAPAGVNRHVLSALLSLEEDGPKDSDFDLTRLAGETLATYLARIAAAPELDDPEAPEVIVIDQFEEILTTAPAAIQAKEQFFAQLGEALRNDRLWLIIAMREDFIAGLDPYRGALPTALRTTFRLHLLGRDAALAAIKGPARAGGVTFLDAAADKLANDLRQVRVQQLDGSVETQLGPHIEPVQLQVVCHSLWHQLRPEDREIGLENLARLGDVDAALATYYDAQVEAAARLSQLAERVLRQWIGRHLVTTTGLRTQVLQTPAQTLELDNTALAALVDAHLLRTDTRRGMTWFELAHDRIVKPLQESNARWFLVKLSPVQRQAELWASQGRPESLLLATREEAERLLRIDELRPETEQEFLEQSKLVRRREASARHDMFMLRVLTIVIAVLIVGWLGVAYVMLQHSLIEAKERTAAAEVEQEAAEARQRLVEAALPHQLIAQVALHRDQQPELAALLGLSAAALLGDDPWPRKAALINIGVTAPQLVARLSPTTPARPSGGSSPAAESGASHPWRLAAAGGKLFAVDLGGQVWALTIANRGATPLLPDELRAVDLAAHPTRPLLAISVAGPAIVVWDYAARRQERRIELPADPESRDRGAWVEGLAFSANGESLLAVRQSGRLSAGFVIELASGVPRPLLGALTLREPSDLGLSANGTLVAQGAGTSNGAIFVYAGAAFKREVITPSEDLRARLHVARFSPDGASLLTGGEGVIALWRVAAGEIDDTPQVVRLGAGETVGDALFMADGKLAILTGTRISLWNGSPLAPWGTPITLPDVGVQGISAAGDTGELIAAAFPRDEPIHVFDPRRLAPIGAAARPSDTSDPTDPPAYPFEHARVSVALNHNATTLAMAGFDAAITLVDVASQAPLGPVTPLAGKIESMLFTGDARLVVADTDGKVTAWDLEARRWTPLGVLPAKPVALAVDGEGQILAATPTTAPHGILVGSERDGFADLVHFGERPATAIAFDERGRYLAIAACNSVIRPSTCRQGDIDIHDLSAPASLVKQRLTVDFAPERIVFSADGRRLASANFERIRAWNLEDGRPITLTVRRELGPFHALDISADGRILAASAITDNAAVDLVLWDLETGEELAPPLRAHNPAIGSKWRESQVLLAGDSGLLVSSNVDGVVLWNIRDDALQAQACALAGRELTRPEQLRFLGTRHPYQALCPRDR